jgi:hypothetical protein
MFTPRIRALIINENLRKRRRRRKRCMLWDPREWAPTSTLAVEMARVLISSTHSLSMATMEASDANSLRS